ncbi:nSTAND1 domain-containing NTPase [Lysinibacillus capsici]|uniref:nSTAND1 domain-containing NTPase n=1 Tax=Lysinibacillus capsici TaxID=2115968 RepID=UPI002DB55DFF|nr:restriction endonuclease [Lysinibacillus capsici]MEC1306034.1 restriction endonuclease [Lysinibacillus capsici]
MSNSIEVVISDKSTTTDKGRLLEKLGSELLTILQYEVTEEVRVTGMEVDLLAKNKINGETIFVECKAHQNNLSADVFTKLLGNVLFKGVSSGWLFTTGPLGKDAKGFVNEWSQRTTDERRKLNVYEADKLIDLLVSSRKIIDVLTLKQSDIYTYSDENTLLITEYGRFWALKVIHASAGIPYGFVLFDAETGKEIIDKGLIAKVKQLKSSLEDLESLTNGLVKSNNNIEEDISEELGNIAIVTGGDQWSDYRPSRPKDFVGREDLFREIFKYFNNVIDNETNTRLLAIKAPSGWGKSSVLLKLISKVKGQRYKTKYFVHAVDVRAAISHRYGELSLLSCFTEAINKGFIKKPLNNMVINNISNPFSNKGVVEILQTLKEENKLLVLCFDQFEEIFSKNELADLFESIRKLSIAIDAAKENIVLCFAWKTDGTTPTDHPAYFMWQNLSDRRNEFQLSTFTPAEMNKALSIFSKELGERLNPNLRKYLIDHCQGYPWLLKKLSIHVHSLIKNGIEQNEIIGKGLDIQTLFERDLNELTSSEIACLKFIARESPADFFKVDQDYGSDTVHSLLNKRLVIRKAHKLILYWDIFRDYVLNGTVPQITISYIPQGNLNKYNDVLQLLLNENTMTLNEISKNAKISYKVTENIVRDLVMFGNVVRKGEEITLLQEQEEDAVEKVHSFFSNHIVLKTIIKEHGETFGISIKEYEEFINRIYKESNFSDKTLGIYKNRVFNWLLGLNLIKVNSNKIYSSIDKNMIPIRISQSKRRIRLTFNSKIHPFLGAAPASRVLELITYIKSGNSNEEELKKLGLRNAITVIKSLNLALKQGDSLKLINLDGEVEKILSQEVLATDTIQLIRAYINDNEKLPSALEVGDMVGDFLNKEWKDASKIRNGNAILNWFKWANQIYER